MDQKQTKNPAETYQDFLGPVLFEPCARFVLEQAAPRPGESVLDLACGTGIVTRQAASLLGARGDVTGVDFSPEMLAVARNLTVQDGAPVQWREASADNLPVEDGAIDLLLCQQGLQFFPDKPAAAREMRRVLTDEGRAVVAVWKSLEHHRVFQALMEAEADHLEVPAEKLTVPFSYGDADTLRALLEDVGFRDVQVVERSLTANFDDPDRFIELVLMAGAAVMPELAEKDDTAREALIRAVTRDASGVINEYREGSRLSFPMHTNIAVARA